MNQKKENSTAMDIFTVIAILLIIGIPIYGYFKLKPDRVFDIGQEPERVDIDSEQKEVEDEKEDKTEEVAEKDEPVVITGYSEELVEIEGQWAYIAVPEPIDSNNLPTLVIYNHGTVSRVEEDLDEDFKNDLEQYAEILTPYNYILGVSNAHGFDLDAPEAIDDNYNLYQYIKEKYGIQDQIYMTGYSKGGVATLNFTDKYPNIVTKIGMIAPRMRLYEWDEQRAQSLQGIDIKVWHGTNDVNVSFTDTEDFIKQMKQWGIEIDLVTLEGKTHWNVNPEYFGDIVEFFNSSELPSE
jgi:hypothetical protein